MEKENYGENYEEHLLQQYKLYIQMADNISARRAQANSFYIMVLSALLAVLSVVAAREMELGFQKWSFLAISILGLILCFIWSRNILSYKQLNAGKFEVIQRMEQLLPYACFTEEWEVLERGGKRKIYFQLTNIERFVPGLMAIPYVILLIYSIVELVK